MIPGGYFLVLAFILSVPYHAFGYAIDDKFDAAEFLARFGYIDKKDMNDGPIELVDLGDPLREFQILSGIEPTGVLDEETMKVMNAPRCGNPDKYPESKRVRRYKLLHGGPKWTKREVTYRTNRLTRKLDEPSVQREIELAFKLWESASNINFVKVTDPEQSVDIDLSFATLAHSDNSPFDGPGKTLAHAFGPGRSPLSGDVHFDDSETWTIETNSGTNVLFVAVHEIGHSIGLDHSAVKGAIMQPRYAGYMPHLKLHPDDIAGAQELYGARVEGSPMQRFGKVLPLPPTHRSRPDISPTTPPSTTPRPPIQTATPRSTLPPFQSPREPTDLCKDPQMDAITTLSNGNIYAFKGDFVYHIGRLGGILSTNKIQTVFPGLHSGIDAALTRANGDTLFFKGDKYWLFRSHKEEPGYPKEIARHFPGIPNGIDAAFESSVDGTLYFFKADKFWRFNQNKTADAKLGKIKPQSLSEMGIIADSIDSAFVTPDKAIFLFSKNKYWRLNLLGRFGLFKTIAFPPYPRNVAKILLKCTA